MQAIFETIFHMLYLTAILVMGHQIYRKEGVSQFTRGFGLMGMLLGFGDAFHLLPRISALWTTGFQNHAVSLGFGKFTTSMTMTLFYLIFFTLLKENTRKKFPKWLPTTFLALTAARIILNLFPQNQWLSVNPPLRWGILRNVPFAAMGILIIVLLFREASLRQDKDFSRMGFAVFCSFLFYIPVVLFAETYPLVGMLMIPKTLAYVYLISIPYHWIKGEKYEKALV